jgi:GNAT superfamily N-acetyltransferase
MGLVIRVACPGDIPAMHRVRSTVRENRQSSPHGVSEASYLPYVEARCTWVAETEAGLVGFAAIDAATKSVWALFVDPNAEGAGVGRALHQRMLTWAREQGLERLTLSTDNGTRAAQFYQRAGWTEIGTTPAGEALFQIIL